MNFSYFQSWLMCGIMHAHVHGKIADVYDLHVIEQILAGCTIIGLFPHIIIITELRTKKECRVHSGSAFCWD